MFIEIPAVNANSVDPDHTPHPAASDQDLNGLPMSILWDARHKWVNVNCIFLLFLYLLISLNRMVPTTTMTTKTTAGRPVVTTIDSVLQVFCQSKDAITCKPDLDPICGSDKNFYLNQ